MAGENPNDQAASLLDVANNKLAETAKEVASLKAENEALKTENETLSAVNEELSAKVEELSKASAAPKSEAAAEKKVTIPTATFKVAEKEYRFVSPVFFYKQQRITAEAALSDEALLAALVTMGSGAIKAV